MIVAELVDGCNLRCELCYNRERAGTFQSMPIDVVARIQELYPKEVIDWFNWGEPTLHNDFHAVALRMNGTRGRISTNFTTPVSDETLQSICCFWQIFVSTSGLTQDVYEKYHHGGNVDIVLSNLERLTKLRRRKVAMRWISHPENLHQRQAAKELCDFLGIEFHLTELNYMMEWVLQKEQHWMIPGPRRSGHRKCKILDWIVINHEGEYMLCCATGAEKLGITVFDDVTREQIVQRKLSVGLCQKCMEVEAWRTIA